MKKRVLSLFLSCLMLFTCIVTTSAADVESDDFGSQQYKETHFQINLSDYNVNVLGNKMSLEAKEPMTISADNTTAVNLDRLEEIFEKYPDVEENLIKDYQSEGELLAVSFTEVPLVYVDGHYERVLASTPGYDSSDENGNGSFLMYTAVSGGVLPFGGKYQYTAKTYGSWVNNISGGWNYPDTGEDYVFQTSPNTFSRDSDGLSATYDTTPTTGVSGDDYWRENGSSTYVRYAIQDDPFGYRQLKNFTLTTVSAGPKSNSVRQIGSYYIHTWEDMSIDVSVDVSTDRAVTLSLNPENTEDSWQVYNYVSFNF